MKKTLLLLASASLVTAQICATKDVVKAAIKAHDAHLLMQVLPLQYNGDAKLKAEYEKFAQEQVEKKAAEAATRFKLSRFYTADGFGALINGAFVVGFGITIADKYLNPKDTDTKLTYWSALIGASANFFRNASDVVKNITATNAKNAESLKKAKTVLRVVQALPVRTAAVSA